MKPRPLLLLLAALALPTRAQSQIPTSFGHLEVDQPGVASPAYDNAGGGMVLVWSTTITEGEDHNGQWMRVFFDRVNISSDDYLNIVSLKDGWISKVKGSQIYPRGVERVDATYSSIFMTGNSVKIELWAKPGNSGGGVSVDYVHVGVPKAVAPVWCSTDNDVYYDYRVGRVVGFRAVPLLNGDQYVACAGTLLFPGSCIVTSAEALAQVGMNFDDVIVEFSDAVGSDATLRAHPHPDDQYRFLEASDCVGPAHGRVLSFRVRPNENTGHTPGYSYYVDNPRGYWFAGPQCTKPALVDHGDPATEPIAVVGWWTNTLWTFDHQTQDILYNPLLDPPRNYLRFANATGELEHDSDAATSGFEGGPIVDDRMVNDALETLPEEDRKLYGIHTVTNCVLGTHDGVSFWDSDMDLDSPTSCVSQSCNDDSEFPGVIDGGEFRNSDGDSFMGMSLPDGPMSLRGAAFLDVRELIREMSGDGLLRVDLGVSAFHMAATGCVGPVQVRLHPTMAASGRVLQLTSGSLYPANGSLELPLEVEVAGQVLHTPTPARLMATLQSSGGYGDTYTLVAPVALVNTLDQPVATLDTWSLKLRAPRSQQYATLRLATGSLGTLTLGGSMTFVPGATAWSAVSRTWVTPLTLSALHAHTTLTGIGTVLATTADSPASLGVLRYPFLPDTFPASAALDVYLELRQQSPPRVLVNHEPLRLAGTWTGYPSMADTMQGLAPVALYDRSTNQLVTMVSSAWLMGGDPIHTAPYPAAGTDAFCASGQVVLDVGQGPMTIGGLLGRAVVDRADPHPEPAEPDPEPALTDTIATELLSMDLHASASPLGPTIVRLRGLPGSPGEIRQQEPESTYPATSFFDVFLEIQSGSGTLHTALPVRIQAEINSLPPTEMYASPSPLSVPLLDTSGQPRGMLLYFTLQPGTPYDPACADRIACSTFPVGVEGGPGPAAGRVALHAAAPNPARDAVWLAFDLPRAGDAQLGVYDVAGRLVRELARGPYAGGTTHRIAWSGTDRDGRRVAAGVYFVRLQAEGRTLTRTVILQR